MPKAKSKPTKASSTAKTATAPVAASATMRGCDVVVRSLELLGVDTVFAYPGGASMELHQALTRTKKIRTILPRHEQGGGFMAHGYARATGKPGVCMATSGPGATNLVTCIADAYMDSIPLVCITGQVFQQFIGKSAFQETDFYGMTLPIVKHSFLVLNYDELPTILFKAFKIATTGRPGPVVIDIPKDVQQHHLVPKFPKTIDDVEIPGLDAVPLATDEELLKVLDLVAKAQQPVLYVGGGIISSGSSDDLREFAKLTGIPVASTLMGARRVRPGAPAIALLVRHARHRRRQLGRLQKRPAARARRAFRRPHHGRNYEIRARRDHRARGPRPLRVRQEQARAPAHRIRCRLRAEAPQRADQGEEFQEARPRRVVHHHQRLEEGTPVPRSPTSATRRTSSRRRPSRRLYRETKGEAICRPPAWASTRCGRREYYRFKEPRTFISSLGAGTMGFGLPAAMGAKVARPDKHVIDIDGDGSFLMNIQELACAVIEKINVKVVILNNQHLGMVTQWEDRFYEKTRGHTILCDPKNIGGPDNLPGIYPDFVTIAKGFGMKARRVHKREELRDAIREMLDHDGPFLLDVIVPHTEHVLPFIPQKKSAMDILTK